MTLLALATTVLLSCAAPAAGQDPVAFGGPRESAERARIALYDSLRDIPRETPVTRVAQAVTPCVVYVETEMVQRVQTIFGTQSQTLSGSGSGVVIHPSGYIVTNYHVVEGARQIRVSFDGDPAPYAARLMSYVREEDLALLKIEPDARRGAAPSRQGVTTQLRPGGDAAFPTVRLGTSADLMPGERVIAIGSPHGQTHTVSTGIISGLHRDVPVPARRLNFHGLIQTDASINRGNSGGPLLNIHGELIGINTVMNTEAENIGFAIPVDRVRQVLTDSLFPRARKVWLGMTVASTGNELRVADVWRDGPAAEQGICAGDRVVSLGGVPVATEEEYLLQLLQLQPGEVARLGLDRNGDKVAFLIESWDEFNGSIFEELGMTVRETRLGRGTALTVHRVQPDSPAAELGVQPGDVIPAVRPRTYPSTGAIRLADKATLKLLLDRIPEGTEIEVDAYRDINGDGQLSKRDELLKGVLIR